MWWFFLDIMPKWWYRHIKYTNTHVMLLLIVKCVLFYHEIRLHNKQQKHKHNETSHLHKWISFIFIFIYLDGLCHQLNGTSGLIITHTHTHTRIACQNNGFVIIFGCELQISHSNTHTHIAITSSNRTNNKLFAWNLNEHGTAFE